MIIFSVGKVNTLAPITKRTFINSEWLGGLCKAT